MHAKALRMSRLPSRRRTVLKITPWRIDVNERRIADCAVGVPRIDPEGMLDDVICWAIVRGGLH
jgi:hypothetical protein